MGRKLRASALLLTVAQAASRMNLSERMGWKLVRLGRLPSVKVGRSRRVSSAALEQFVRDLEGEGAA